MTVEQMQPSADWEWQRQQGAAALYNGQTWHVYAGNEDSHFFQVHPDPNSDLSDKANWNHAKVSKDQTQKRVRSRATPALVPLGQFLYLFYIDRDKQKLSAVRYDGALQSWSSYTRILDLHGNSIYASDEKQDISAMEFNGNLIVCLTDPTNKRVIYYRLEAPEIWETAWQVSQLEWRLITQIAVEFELTGLDENTTIERETGISWFAGLTEKTDDELTGAKLPDPAPQNIMVQSLQFKEKSGSLAYYLLQWIIDENGLPQSAFANDRFVYDIGGVTVTRDPGGRIRTYFLMSSEVYANTLSAAPDFSGGNLFKWLGGGPLNGNSYTSHRPPVGAFVPVGEPEKENATVDIHVNEMVFYCKNKSDRGKRNLLAQFAPYGQLRRVENAGVINLTDETKGKEGPAPEHRPASSLGRLEVLGYIDGPPPFPNINLEADPESRYSAEVVYGKTQNTSETHAGEVELSIGVSTERSVSVGVGVGYEASFKATGGQRIANTEGVTVETTMTGEYGRSAADKEKVTTQGTIFARQIVVLRDEFQFIPNGSKDPILPIWATFRLAEEAPILVLPYDVFTVKPGDLDSYSKEYWDEKMGAGYFQNKIEANAVDLDANLASPSLEPEPSIGFSYGVTGKVSTASAATAKTFKERSWSFNAELYGKVFADVKAWGVGFTSKSMIGFSTSVKALDGKSRENRWGIEVPQTLPQRIDGTAHPDAVATFSWNLFLVEASTEWSKELFDNLTDAKIKNAIDTNSACWKIVYEVNPSSIVRFGSPLGDLVDKGFLSEVSHRALTARGINTVAELVHDFGIDSFENLDEQVEERLNKAA